MGREMGLMEQMGPMGATELRGQVRSQVQLGNEGTADYLASLTVVAILRTSAAEGWPGAAGWSR